MRITCSTDNNKSIKVLPVVRVGDFSYTLAANNENHDSVKYGQIKVMGRPALATLSISSFFPSKKYEFVDSKGSTTPKTYIDWFTACISKRKPIRVVITHKKKTIFNKLMALESFEVADPDRQGDIAYTMQLEEYIKVK